MLDELLMVADALGRHQQQRKEAGMDRARTQQTHYRRSEAQFNQQAPQTE